MTESETGATRSSWLDLLSAPEPPTRTKPTSLPTLSIIIPSYNCAGTIGEALESVLTQVPEPLEIIVSDDGSEDDLEHAVGPFRSRITFLKGPHRGVSCARNRAAEAAQGKLLGLLDADDIWLPGRAAAFMAVAAARPDLSILTTDALVVRDGEVDADTYYDVRKFEVDRQDLAILQSNFIFGAGAVRRAALLKVGGYDQRAIRASDWSLWLRLILSGHRAGLIRAALYEYRRRPGSLTSKRVDLAIAVVTLLDNSRELLTGSDQLPVLVRSQQEWRRKAARFAHRMKDDRKRRLALEALRSSATSLPQAVRLLAYLCAP